MNIFVLDNDPKIAAQMQCDKHVVKMVLETAQLLSTAQHVTNNSSSELYRKTHENHPCSIWTRTSIKNYEWLYKHFKSLSEEYTFRYGKKHKSWSKLAQHLIFAPNIPHGELTSFAQAMPEQYRNDDPVIAYQNYYCGEKAKIAKWTKRKIPEWFLDRV